MKRTLWSSVSQVSSIKVVTERVYTDRIPIRDNKLHLHHRHGNLLQNKYINDGVSIYISSVRDIIYLYEYCMITGRNHQHLCTPSKQRSNIQCVSNERQTNFPEINYIFNEKSNQIAIRSVLIYELIVPDTWQEVQLNMYIHRSQVNGVLKIEANEGQSAQCIYEHIYGSIRQLTKRDLERSLEDIVCVYEV